MVRASTIATILLQIVQSHMLLARKLGGHNASPGVCGLQALESAWRMGGAIAVQLYGTPFLRQLIQKGVFKRFNLLIQRMPGR